MIPTAALSSMLGGIPVVVSDHLPLTPSDGEVARRIVRHGLARVLEQLGEGVGPRPEDQTEVLLIDGSMFMSEDAHDRVRAVVAMTGTNKREKALS